MRTRLLALALGGLAVAAAVGWWARAMGSGGWLVPAQETHDFGPVSDEATLTHVFELRTGSGSVWW